MLALKGEVGCVQRQLVHCIISDLHVSLDHIFDRTTQASLEIICSRGQSGHLTVLTMTPAFE